MAQQLDFYIEETKRQEASGNLELALIAELNSIPQDRNAQVTKKTVQDDEQNKIAAKAEQFIVQEEQSGAANPVGKAIGTPCRIRRITTPNTAHNWWLALIAFLLFLILILKD